ncbi:PadR family transcriptional regulator [Candidatus Bathyarchaeota archaeon]|nr:PadR family transcriptional regulator [Candidatus Bathyarchaeota archaeon]
MNYAEPKRHHPHFRYWMRHIAAVPKGFLRYQVLELLNEKPLSGSEIMNEIEDRTNGLWRPSPGSVYPLLAWLRDSGYIKEAPTEESGVKRYLLTENGKRLLEEQRKIRRQLRDKAKFFVPPFLGAIWYGLSSKKAAELQKSCRRLIQAFINIGINVGRKFSEKAFEETIKVLDEAAAKLEEINKKLEEK